ncbi:Retrovirus-related Pol polyprotein from transposon RE1 [Vitis vinifera]|uniref:Retrovirus-related Pol polyprotein from transposon RE1 n=1 Tax=Vitis vinifera TaxID=29760 RepID=A0A438HGY1_VITVI|nr:Retrovirus-related Pol polyprotein from transposon RE1 [Vitis vinifera]
MSKEFDALLSNGTWDLVPPYPYQNLVNCKWVFHIKHKSDGSIERYKARLVTKGFHQHPDIDYHDTFEDVYMVQPLGFIDQNLPNHVFCLRKALYGLEQALWAWYTELRLFLVAASNDLGFINKFVSQLATRSPLRTMALCLSSLELRPTPFSPTHNLTLFDDTSLTDPIKYRQVVGSLQYTSLTRPNIAFAVNKLSQFMHRPTLFIG